MNEVLQLVKGGKLVQISPVHMPHVAVLKFDFKRLRSESFRYRAPKPTTISYEALLHFPSYQIVAVISARGCCQVQQATIWL